MASSSTSGHHVNTPAPPPPTPSNQNVSKPLSLDADDALSRFLNQLVLNQKAPSLSSLPRRFARKSSSSHVPLISLAEPQRDVLLSAASDIGYFHLADHGISSDLFNRAIQESQSLFRSDHVSGVRSTLGFNHDDDGFLVFDACSTELEAFPAVSEYAKSLERAGLEVVELMFSAAGLENPFRNETLKPRCLMWVSSSSTCSRDVPNTSVIKEEEEEEERGDMENGKRYPYVVSLQYEVKATSVMGDSGEWIVVDPRSGSVLVTLGDIAQVWSNGRFKKVRGMPQRRSASSADSDDSLGMSISLLVTLPMDSTVSPLLPLSADAEEGGAELEGARARFQPFSFEEYAWRVYHDRFPFKDPLLRYKV